MNHDNYRHRQHLEVSSEELNQGFDAVLDSIERLSPEQRADLALQAESALLGYEAYAMGMEYAAQGEIHQAVRWLTTASNHGVAAAHHMKREIESGRSCDSQQSGNADLDTATVCDRSDTGQWSESTLAPAATQTGNCAGTRLIACATHSEMHSLLANARNKDRLHVAGARKASPGRVLVWDQTPDERPITAAGQSPVGVVRRLSTAIPDHKQPLSAPSETSLLGEQQSLATSKSPAQAESGYDGAHPVTNTAHMRTPRGGPTVLRIVLGVQLRKLRQERGISREEAGTAIRASHARISRIELGRVAVKERDLAKLLTLYGVNDAAERSRILEWARQGNTPSWWHPYRDLVPSHYQMYMDLEEAASLIRNYEALLIPGLLQTEDYARAVFRGSFPSATSEEVDRKVALRMKRQERITTSSAPNLWAIIDEAALRRPLGGASLMRDQIRHLAQVSERSNVTVQILPFEAGVAMSSPLTLLRFADQELPDIAFIEQLTSALYLEVPSDVEQYSVLLDSIGVAATSPHKTREFLQQLLRDY